MPNQETEDFDIYASWISAEVIREEFVGSVELDPDDMPQELEINGVTYIGQF